MRAELQQVIVDELRIQQNIAALPEAGDEVDQRNLAGIRRGRKHALAKERAAERNAVDAADQLFALPRLDAMRIALMMQRGVEVYNIVIDPGFRPHIGAAANDACKIFIEADAVGALADGFGKALWHMQVRD